MKSLIIQLKERVCLPRYETSLMIRNIPIPYSFKRRSFCAQAPQQQPVTDTVLNEFESDQPKTPYFFLAFLRGTFPPARRASDSPIAMACFRLVTFLPERPLFKVPFLRSCIALLTFCAAFLPYLAIRITPL